MLSALAAYRSFSMKLSRTLAAFSLLACALFVRPAGGESEEKVNKHQYAKSFEALSAVHAALANDDDAAARALARPFAIAVRSEFKVHPPQMLRAAGELAVSTSLEDAREAFAEMSNKFSNHVSTEEGYYTMVCTVRKNSQFVQRDPKVHTCPFGGLASPKCARHSH